MPVKHIKNVNPTHNQMVLYKSPKGFFKKLRKVFTWKVHVWVVKCFFTTLSPAAAVGYTFRLDNSNWTYGVVKEEHDNLWVSNNGGFKQLNSACVYMSDVCEYARSGSSIPLQHEDVFVTTNPSYNGRWDAAGGSLEKGSNVSNENIRELDQGHARAFCKDYNN